MHADPPDDGHAPLEEAIARGELDAELVWPGVPTPTVRDAARALGVTDDQIIKSLLFQTPDGRVVLAVASGPTKVHRKRLAALVDARDVRLAAADVVLERTGYPAGGTAPVIHATPLDVIVDARVLSLPVVYGGGGKVDALLRIRPEEIVRVTGARVADIAD